ncbi:hypothetical protein Tco_0152425 [Tanacetum coccineum]
MAALQYKDDHNRIAYLGRERGSEDFTDILSYLDHSPLRYALTHDPPVVFDSLVKQFWATATVRPNAAGSHDLVAAIDGREVVVTESLIRAQLQLDDANGIFDMQIDDIFAGMGAIGYPPGRTLTFLKHHLSPQWRFLVHTILHCLSPKAGSWNQFPSSIATALICLSTGRVYNFSRFILEGLIANVKATRHKFLMYPRFLQMLVAIETADRTPRPTFGFTRKLFTNMKLKWEGEAIPLTPPMLAIAAAGNDAADEENVLAHAVAGSPAEAHPVPHPPPFSPVREPTPERLPETEWVVPIPVSPITDWRPWPSVPAPSPIRDPTPEPASPPTPPAQTLRFEEPLVFGPVPKPAGYVDPDNIAPPANYIEPEDITNLNSMEDETILGGFHEETHAGPDDAPTPTADAAGRAEDPALLTSLSAKIDRLRFDLKDYHVSASEALGHDQATVPSEDIEEREEEEVPLRRKRSVHRRARTEFYTPAFAQFHAPRSTDVLPHADISESAARKRLEEDRQVRAVRRISDLACVMTTRNGLTLMMQVGTNPALARELLGAGVTKTTLLSAMMQLRNGEEALRFYAYRGTQAVTAMSKQQLTGRLRGILQTSGKGYLLSDQYNLFRTHAALLSLPSKRQRVERAYSQPSVVLLLPRNLTDDPDSDGVLAMDSAASHHELGISPFAYSDNSSSPSPVSTDHIPIDVLFDSTSGGLHEFFLASDEDAPIGMSRIAADPASEDECTPDSLSGGDNRCFYVWRQGLILIQGPLLERLLIKGSQFHPHTVDVVVAGECYSVRFRMACGNPMSGVPLLLCAKGLTSPEQTATGKGISNPLMAVMVCPKPYGIQLTNVSRVNTPGSDENRLKFFDLMYILVNGAVAAKSGSCCLEMLLDIKTYYLKTEVQDNPLSPSEAQLLVMVASDQLWLRKVNQLIQLDSGTLLLE